VTKRATSFLFQSTCARCRIRGLSLLSCRRIFKRP
jgi:hypothetical protein